MFLNCVWNVDVINVNDIEDDCDDEVSKEHADDLLGVDGIGSIPSTFDPNVSSMKTEEPNVLIQHKWMCCCFKYFRIYVFRIYVVGIYVVGCFVLNIL